MLKKFYIIYYQRVKLNVDSCRKENKKQDVELTVNQQLPAKVKAVENAGTPRACQRHAATHRIAESGWAVNHASAFLTKET